MLMKVNLQRFSMFYAQQELVALEVDVVTKVPISPLKKDLSSTFSIKGLGVLFEQ